MPFLQIFFWIVPIMSATLYLLLLIFMLMSKKDKLIKAFIPVLLTLIVWSGGSLLMRLPVYPSTHFWNIVMCTGMLFLPFSLYYFISVFTNTVNKVKVVIIGILSSFVVFLNLLGLVVSQATIVNSIELFNGIPYTKTELIYTLGWAAVPAYLFMFIFIALIYLKTLYCAKNGLVSYKRIIPIVVGIAIIFLGALSNIFDDIGKYPVDIFASFINCILIIIAIYKGRMLELRFMLTKGFLYSIVALIITVIYAFVVFTFQQAVGERIVTYIPYFTTVSALVIAFMFQPIFGVMKKLVDKIFYKGEYSQRLALRNFSVNTANQLDLQEITDELLSAVQNGIRTRIACLMLSNEEKKNYKVAGTTAELSDIDITISFDNPIITWFVNNNNNLTRDEILTLPFFQSMWDSEIEAIKSMNIEIIVPIKCRNNLIGILLLTKKNRNLTYTLEDKDLLSALAASTAVAIDNARLYARAQKEATIDSLTNLYNHGYFFKELANQIKKRSPVSLIMMDLDMFKLYNDLYGHVEGDKALQKVASIIRMVIGDRGTSFRYGGEEFAILLPYLDSNKAYELAEKIRSGLQDSFLKDSDSIQKILTISVGICTYPYAAPNADELTKRADLALYNAKNTGKNKTIIYTPSIIDYVNPTSGSLNEVPPYETTIYALTAAIDAKDHFTFGHSQNVAEYTTILANELKMDKNHIIIAREAALLHDIGKIGIPETILAKPGRLTEQEYIIIKKHVEMSIEIIKHLPTHKHVAPAILGHHERWDGKGYPRGVAGESIPVLARCLALADSFDAMTSIRPYKKELTVDFALNEIRSQAGKQFDPDIAKTFIDLIISGKIRVKNDNNFGMHLRMTSGQ